LVRDALPLQLQVQHSTEVGHMADPTTTNLTANASSPFSLDLQGAQPIIQAIKNNDPLPALDIEFPDLKAGVSGATSIPLSDGQFKADLSGSASASLALGIYSDPAKLVDALSTSSEDLAGPDQGLDLQLQAKPSTRFVCLRTSYALAGKVAGTVALGTYGTVSFGVDARNDALYALLHRVPQSYHFRDALQETINSLRLPSQAWDAAAQPGPGKPPAWKSGTWLVTDVEGQINGTLGATFGYSYNWVRTAQLAGLSGDIGLKLQLAVDAQLGWNLAGRFLHMTGLEDDGKTLRLRVFKLRKQGLDFALNAGVSVTTSTGKFLPDNVSDFLKALFGTHGLQILKDLQSVQVWTDSNQTLPDALAGIGGDFLNKLWAAVGTNFPGFDIARQKLLDLLKKWDGLSQSVTSLILKYIGDQPILDAIKNAATKIQGFNETSATNYLEDLLKDTGIGSSPIVKWLEAAAGGPLFDALSKALPLTQIQDVAQKTLEILDGSELQKLLQSLQTIITTRLGLDVPKIEGIIACGNLSTLDDWLKAKLASFLKVNANAFGLAELGKIRDTIKAFDSAANSLYSKTLAALNKTYGASLALTYQRTDTKTALLDVTFDVTNPALKQKYLDAVGGKFTEILAQQIPGIELKTGMLTHNIVRHTHVDLTLPFYKSSVDDINQALASATAADHDGERVFLYDLHGSDTETTKINQSLYRSSALLVGISSVAGPGIRQHDKDVFSFEYTFRQLRTQTKRTTLDMQIEFLLREYFPGRSMPASQSASLSDWLTDWDKFADGVPSAKGTGIFGNTLLEFKTSVSTAVNASLLDAMRANPLPDFRSMSAAIQVELRRSQLEAYLLGNPSAIEAAPLLVYASMPVTNGLTNIASTLTNDPKGFYWDVQDRLLRDSIVSAPETRSNLEASLRSVQAGFGGDAAIQKWLGSDILPACNTLLETVTSNPGGLLDVLTTESTIVRGARDSFSNLLGFVKTASNSPDKAVDLLTNFGLKVSTAFGGAIQSQFDTAKVLQTIGVRIYLAACRGLYPSSVGAAPMTLIDLAILKGDTLPDLDAEIKPTDVILEQRLLG
jgi:hypothetical protein